MIGRVHKTFLKYGLNGLRWRRSKYIPSETSRSQSPEGGAGEKWDILGILCNFVEEGKGHKCAEETHGIGMGKSLTQVVKRRNCR